MRQRMPKLTYGIVLHLLAFVISLASYRAIAWAQEQPR
jgi:hypothetical protein